MGIHGRSHVIQVKPIEGFLIMQSRFQVIPLPRSSVVLFMLYEIGKLKLSVATRFYE